MPLGGKGGRDLSREKVGKDLREEKGEDLGTKALEGEGEK